MSVNVATVMGMKRFFRFYLPLQQMAQCVQDGPIFISIGRLEPSGRWKRWSRTLVNMFKMRYGSLRKHLRNARLSDVFRLAAALSHQKTVIAAYDGSVRYVGPTAITTWCERSGRIKTSTCDYLDYVLQTNLRYGKDSVPS